MQHKDMTQALCDMKDKDLDALEIEIQNKTRALAAELKAVRDEKRSREYKLKIGDKFKLGDKQCEVTSFEYFPKYRMATKKGAPSKKERYLYPSDLEKIQRLGS